MKNKNKEATHECYICHTKKRHKKRYGDRPEGWWTLTKSNLDLEEPYAMYFCEKCKLIIQNRVQKVVETYNSIRKMMSKCIGCNEDTGPQPDCPKCGNYCAT